MPIPFPDERTVDLSAPDRAETLANAAGILSATRVGSSDTERGSNTEFQRLLMAATFESMTGHSIVGETLPVVSAHEFAEGLRRRAEAYRMRMVHMMILSALVLRPLTADVAERVAEFSREIGIDDRLLSTVRSFAETDRAMAAIDFERNGYTSDWSDDRASALHASSPVTAGWAAAPDDADLAARWQALGGLPDGTLGKGVHEFYMARGFSVPGSPGSAPPLLAQHDWVHVLADYGTKVEAELEVFAFIARANDHPRGFSLLAMVVSLFETGYLSEGAGLFEAFPGQLSLAGMTTRLGDALRRGALSHGLHGAPDVDFMAVDWFEHADQSIADLRIDFNIVEKSANAIADGSVSPWEPGGISEAQLASGQLLADRLGISYDPRGATI